MNGSSSSRTAGESRLLIDVELPVVPSQAGDEFLLDFA